MSIASEITRLQTAKTNLATSIANKGVTVPSATKLDGYSALVDQIVQGSDVNESDPIRFFDYDGTLLYSYTVDEFASVTGLPENPTHSGLTAQGWNWGLSEIRTQISSCGYCDVGQTYTTDDGKTRIYIKVPSANMCISTSMYVNGTVTIDFGDPYSTATRTITGTSISSNLKTVQHTYSVPGEYMITFNLDSGTEYAPNGNSNDYSQLVYGNENAGTSISYMYAQNMTVYKIEIGAGWLRLRNYVFNNLSALETITIPNTVSYIESTQVFRWNSSLKFLAVPRSLTGNFNFTNCYGLKAVSFPPTLENYGFSFINSLIKRIVVPYSCTALNGSAAYTCYCLEEFKANNSSLSFGTNMLQNSYSLMEMTIPAGWVLANSSFYLSGITKITLENGITTVPTSCFYSCTRLITADLPNSLTSIQNSAFKSCERLRYVNIPEGVTSIAATAFQSCTSLHIVTIPSTVTSVGASAFAYTTGVREYHLLPTTPPTAGSKPLGTIRSDAVVYVPSGALSTYQSATNWALYANYMQEETT